MNSPEIYYTEGKPVLHRAVQFCTKGKLERDCSGIIWVLSIGVILGSGSILLLMLISM